VKLKSLFQGPNGASNQGYQSQSNERDLSIELTTRVVASMHRLTVELSCLRQNIRYLEAELISHLLSHGRVDHAANFLSSLARIILLELSTLCTHVFNLLLSDTAMEDD